MYKSLILQVISLDDPVFEIIFYLLHGVQYERLSVKKEKNDRRFRDVYWKNITLCEDVC